MSKESVCRKMEPWDLLPVDPRDGFPMRERLLFAPGQESLSP